MGGMTGEVHFKKTFFLEGGFIYFHVPRALGCPTGRTSAKAILDWLAQGLLVLSVVLLAQVDNLDIIVDPILYVGICVI